MQEFDRSNTTIQITNLRLQAIIGCNDWEREQKQEIILNAKIEFDSAKAIYSDLLEHTLDYRSLKKRIIGEVDKSSFQLLEKLTDHILNLIMNEPLVLSASVKIDKPRALRFADSVSAELSARRR